MSISKGKTWLAMAEVLRKTLWSYQSMSTPSALWNSGRAWSRTYMVRVDREEEEADPEPVEAAGQLGVGAHQERECLAVAELVVAPLLEPFEDRVEALLRVRLEVAEDGDVAGVADLLGEVGGVVDELRLEEGVFLRLGQEAEIDADAGPSSASLMKPAWRASSRDM